MSDFLGNLAARGLNLTETIQPRVASIFAPLPSAWDPSSGNSIDQSMVDGDKQLAETDSDIISSRPPQMRPLSHADSSILPERFEGSPSDEPRSDEMAGSLRLKTSEPRLQSAIEPAPRSLITQRIVNPKTGEPAPVSNVLQQFKPQPVRVEALAVPSQPATKAGSNPASIAQPSVHKKREAFATPQTSATRDKSAPNKFLQPSITQRVKPEISTTSKSAEKAESGPTIRVNIGRIEVRAVAPPVPFVPQQKHPRPAPMLSLEDYLKQRNRGQ